MKPKHLFAFLFATFQFFNFSTVFGQANTYWHDRIDTTIYATTTGTNTYTGTNTNTNFNVNKYVRGLLVSTFIVNGNTGAATYRLVTASGTLSTAAIKKANGAALVSGDIPDSSAVFLLYYGNFWRLVALHSVSTGITVGVTTITGGTSGAIPFNSAGVYQEDATELFWDNTNDRLGLGTNSPDASLNIEQAVDGANPYLLELTNTTNNAGTFSGVKLNAPFSPIGGAGFGFIRMGSQAGTGVFDIGSTTNWHNDFYTNNTLRVRMHGTTGNVGIGTSTTAPSGRLTVFGSGATPATNTAEFHNSTGTSNSLMIRDDINWGFGINSWGTDAVKVLSMGSGTAPTTSPADAFQLYSADISAGNAALFTRAEGGEIYSIGTEFGTQSNSALNIATNSTTRFTVQTDGGTQFSYRVIEKQGTDIASAATIVIPADGNTFELTGTTAVTLITTTGWQEGATITLIANENVTITNGTATSGANVTILLSGAANFNMTANDVLTLKLSSTTAGGQAWREASRSVN